MNDRRPPPRRSTRPPPAPEAVHVVAGTYPTDAARTYALTPQDLDGDETEGATATFVAGTGTFYAYNLGGSIPPVGSKVVVHAVGGRWCFRWD